MTEGLFGLLGVALGLGYSEWKAWRERKLTHGTYWKAIDAEVEYIKDRITVFLRDNVAAPSYRLPDLTFKACFPLLLSGGATTREDAVALLTFYSEVETFNRGMDRAADAPNSVELMQEYNRNRLKAEHLGPDGAAYKAANLCVQSHL